MNDIGYIQKKLHGFIRKYYINEIIKGSILFISFGFLYFILTLFIEYFLWLQPLFRTILFWIFIIVEAALLTKFVALPISKLTGLRKGISYKEASRIIGRHFKEVDDKLLNVLQLNESNIKTDLLVASIDQKAQKLQPIPFKKAIDFHSNKKYIKYLSIPLFIWLLVYITGNQSLFENSLNRVVHHKVAFEPPAPFFYKILNEELLVVEGKSFKLIVNTVGNIVPEDVRIHFNEEAYYLNSNGLGSFSYKFERLQQSVDFYLEANGIRSVSYKLNLVRAPKVVDFEMHFKFPDYLDQVEEIIKNTGNASVPNGTVVSWNIDSQNTGTIGFDSDHIAAKWMDLIEKDKFKLSHVASKSFNYQISTSNKELKDYEQLNYRIQVIKDEFPKISVRTDIDSVIRGPVQFAGELSDDYGISKLQVIAKSLTKGIRNSYNIEIGTTGYEEFFYVFPDGFILEEGEAYELFFEVFDNDGIADRKKTKSTSFYYRNRTEKEIENELLKEQKGYLEEIEKSSNDSKELQESLEKLSEKLKGKNNTDWNDQKEWNRFLEKQKKYQQMLEQNSDDLLNNLKELDDVDDQNLDDKKELLEQRIKETKELEQKEKLLRELQELTDQLKREELLEKVDRLKEQMNQEQRSLERILELTKRFYIERKSAQIIRKIEELSEKQQLLSESEENESVKQEDLNKVFDSISKEIEGVLEQNNELKDPMNLPDSKKEQKDIKNEMNEAKENLMEGEKQPDSSKGKKARAKQKSASKKMKELSKKMKSQMMEMQMEGSEENIKDLQQILDNLLIFSFDQEGLMKSFENIDSKSASYPGKLKKQQVLKEYFEHIDDSLYMLSLRMVRLSSRIKDDLTDAHYNLDKSLQEISDNKIQKGISHQHFTMTAANNLADLLSDLLNNLQNMKPGNGSGKGKEGESVSLPDIIKKQKKLIENMKKGPLKDNNKGSGSGEELSGQQYEIYKEQNRLKEELKGLLENDSGYGENGKKAVQLMEDLEKMLLEKGMTQDVIDQMKKLDQELLKMENANYERGRDSKRKSEFELKEFNKNSVGPIENEWLKLNRDELLLRKELPLQSNYQRRVRWYFENNN